MLHRIGNNFQKISGKVCFHQLKLHQCAVRVGLSIGYTPCWYTEITHTHLHYEKLAAKFVSCLTVSIGLSITAAGLIVEAGGATIIGGFWLSRILT